MRSCSNKIVCILGLQCSILDSFILLFSTMHTYANCAESDLHQICMIFLICTSLQVIVMSLIVERLSWFKDKSQKFYKCGRYRQ